MNRVNLGESLYLMEPQVPPLRGNDHSTSLRHGCNAVYADIAIGTVQGMAHSRQEADNLWGSTQTPVPW